MSKQTYPPNHVTSLAGYLVGEAAGLDDGVPVVLERGAEAVRKMAIAAVADRDRLVRLLRAESPDESRQEKP